MKPRKGMRIVYRNQGGTLGDKINGLWLAELTGGQTFLSQEAASAALIDDNAVFINEEEVTA